MSSFLYVRKDQTVPIETLGLHMEKNPVYVSVALVEEGAIQIESSFKEVTQLNNALTIFKDKERFIYFSDTEATVEDRQPFVLMKWPAENEGDPEDIAMVLFADGDFSGFNRAQSTFSDAYHMNQEEISPYINTLSDACDGDIEKLMKALGSDSSKKKFEKYWVGRGTLCFLASNEQSLMYTLNDQKRDYVWGSASTMYEEAAAAVPDVVVKKGRSLAAALSAAPSGASSSLPAAPAPKPTTGKPTLALPPKPTATKIPDEKVERWFPPASLTGKPLKAEIRGFMRKHYGHNNLPEGWSEMCKEGFIIPAKKVVKDLKDLPAVQGNTALAPAPKPTDGNGHDKDEPLIVDQKIWDAVQDDFLDRFDFTKKTLDASGKTIMDPDNIQAAEVKRPTFVDKTGLGGLEDVFKFTDEDNEFLCTKYPTAAAVLLSDLIRSYYGMYVEMDKATTKVPEKEVSGYVAPKTVAPAPKRKLKM